MRREQFSPDQRSNLVTSRAGDECFEPPLLPVPVTYDSRLVSRLSRADQALGELAGAGRRMRNPHLLITPYLFQEAVQSTRIEGTQVTLEEMLILNADADKSDPRSDIDQREVLNYVAAVELGIERLRSRPVLGLNLLLELHSRLLAGVGDARGRFASPGQFRTIQNFISGGDNSIQSAIYVPPPPETLDKLLKNWERIANVPNSEYPDLITCALLHAQFESIHPFIDGNGRMGRLLITLFLILRERLPSPLLYLSAFIEPRKDRYYDLLQETRTRGRWEDWIEFFLEGVIDASTSAVAQIQRLDDYDAMKTQELLASGKSSYRTAALLIPYLIAYPFVTVSTVKRLLQVSDPTARSVVKLLENLGIIHVYDNRPWGRRYVCRDVLSIIYQSSQ